jgi:hypothetical protein
MGRFVNILDRAMASDMVRTSVQCLREVLGEMRCLSGTLIKSGQ